MKNKLIFAAIMTLSCLFAGCKDNNNSSEGSSGMGNEIYELKTDIISDRQSYDEGEIHFPNSLWQTPNATEVPDYNKGKIKAVLLDSVSYKGEITKVFAYVGVPEHEAGQKIPGIVLVHGGGGTAYYDWVRMWVNRGYAAISMDTEGHIPLMDADMRTGVYPVESTNPYSNAPDNAHFADDNLPIEEQWMYHSAASVIVSTSYLLSLDDVDPQRVGITGISYGGETAAIVTGYDDRLAFSIPVYGCLALKGTAGIHGNIFRSHPTAARLWDTTEPLSHSRTPIMFIDGNVDNYFTPDAITNSCNASPLGKMLLSHQFSHGHGQGSSKEEIYAFADYIVGLSNHPLTEIVTQPSKDTDSFTYKSYDGDVIPTVYYTSNSVLNNETLWLTATATCKNGVCTIDDIPADASYLYVNLLDKQAFEVSSNVIKLR